MLINILPYTGQSPQHRIIGDKMFTVPRLRNSSIDVKLHFSHFVDKVLLYSQPSIFLGRHRFPWFLGPPNLLCSLWLSAPSWLSLGLLSGLTPGPLFRYPLMLKHSAYLLAVSLSLPFISSECKKFCSYSSYIFQICCPWVPLTFETNHKNWLPFPLLYAI